MLQTFLKLAQDDQPVYISDVYDAFQRRGTRPFHLCLTMYDGSLRSFPLRLPAADSAAERAFLAEYVHAFVYNLLSSLGARRLDVYLDPADRALGALADALPDVFALRVPRLARAGYGKCLNVNDRVLAALAPADGGFRFGTHPLSEEPAPSPAAVETGTPVFAALPARAARAMLLGIDVGGTDIKLCASVNGTLCACKEFDWFPAAFSQAEELTEPVVFLTRLLRAAASLAACGRQDAIEPAALDRCAARAEMEQALARMERAAGGCLRGFDAIGLSFPDVVIDNQIVGGETYKTRGMRENTALDYETEFARIGALRTLLGAYTVPGGAVLLANDGPMAAFTEAVEQAASGADVSHGFFAHTLGTELGTGWVRADGSIPQIPLEVYNFIIDLGSYRQRTYDADDVRSVLNFNTGLPGTLQKYPSQSGVFRLAAKYLPAQDAALWAQVLEKGLFRQAGEKLIVPTQPEDLRKPCLEFFMEQAAAGNAVCQEIFRQIGESVAVTWEQTELLLKPAAKSRTLFGRLVKHETCFRLLCEGARRRQPELRLAVADDSIASTPLMRQLAAHPVYTVAQFAQAAGALHFAALGL